MLYLTGRPTEHPLSPGSLLYVLSVLYLTSQLLRRGTKGTAEPALLRTTWRETPRPASNGQGPPSITDRLRSTADGAQAAADALSCPRTRRRRASERAAVRAWRSRLRRSEAGPVTWSASWTRRRSACSRWSVARRP